MADPYGEGVILAEDVLLLLLNDTSGKAVVDKTRLDLALAGGILLDLTTAGRVDVAGPGEQVKRGRLVVRDARPTGDDVLDEALRRPRDVLVVGRTPAPREAALVSLLQAIDQVPKVLGDVGVPAASYVGVPRTSPGVASPMTRYAGQSRRSTPRRLPPSSAHPVRALWRAADHRRPRACL